MDQRSGDSGNCHGLAGLRPRSPDLTANKLALPVLPPYYPAS
jgi:hypothetical protein